MIFQKFWGNLAKKIKPFEKKEKKNPKAPTHAFITWNFRGGERKDEERRRRRREKGKFQKMLYQYHFLAIFTPQYTSITLSAIHFKMK